MSNGNVPGVNAFLGFMAVLLGHIIACIILYALSATEIGRETLNILLFYAFIAIGFTQLIYVVPLCIWLRSKGRFDTLKGAIIAALVTLLLNGACFLLFLGSPYGF